MSAVQALVFDEPTGTTGVVGQFVIADVGVGLRRKLPRILIAAGGENVFVSFSDH